MLLQLLQILYFAFSEIDPNTLDLTQSQIDRVNDITSEVDIDFPHLDVKEIDPNTLDLTQSQIDRVNDITSEVDIDFPHLDISDLCNDQIRIEDQLEYSDLLKNGAASMLVAIYRKYYYVFIESNTYLHYVFLLDQYMLSRERFITSKTLGFSKDEQGERRGNVEKHYCAFLEYSKNFKRDRDIVLHKAYMEMRAYVEKSIES